MSRIFNEKHSKSGYYKSNHKKISEKLIFYFYDELNSASFVEHSADIQGMCEKIAERTGFSEDAIQMDLEYIKRLQISNTISDNELLKLEKILHTFSGERKNL